MTEENKVKTSHVLDGITADIVTTLIENEDRNYTKKKLWQESGIGKGSLYRRWPTLTNLNIVKEANVASDKDYYTLNRDSKATKLLEELMYDVIEVEKRE